MSAPIAIVQQAAAKVGGIQQLARLLGIQHPSFYHWRRVPPHRVLQLEKISGISRHDIRPDIYPREDTPHEHPDAEADAD